MEHGTRRYPDLLLHSSFSVVLPFFCLVLSLRKVLFCGDMNHMISLDMTRVAWEAHCSFFFLCFLQGPTHRPNMQTDTPITAI